MSSDATESNNAGIDPESFSSTAEFQVAIDTIAASIALLVDDRDEVLAKRAAVDKARNFFVGKLEKLQETIQNHPKREVLAQKEAQLALQQTIERQGNMIKSDEQFMWKLNDIISNHVAIRNKHVAIRNKDEFLTKFLDRFFTTGSFDHIIFYGEYEKYSANESVLAVIEMQKKWDGYIVILISSFGFQGKTLEIGKIPMLYTERKRRITPNIQLCPEYIQSRSAQ